MRVAPALRLVQDAQPRYPARALDRRLDGRVELMFTVRPDGSVADLRVVDAQPAGVFDQAALQAARRWRFAPIPVATTTTRALRFAPPRG
jgi:protein TonB